MTDILKYNFEDIYKYAITYKTREHGVVTLLDKMYRKKWKSFNKYKKILDTTRWVHYLINPEKLLNSGLTDLDKAIIIQIASKRDYSKYFVYGDNSINVNRVTPFIDIDYLNNISLIRINDNKITLIFEEN